MAYLKDLIVTGDSRLVGDLNMNGNIKGKNNSGSWIYTLSNGALNIDSPSGNSAAAIITAKVKSGRVGIETLYNSNNLYFVYGSDTDIASNTNKTTAMNWNPDNNTLTAGRFNGILANSGYATCTTAAATVAKIATLSTYELISNGFIAVKFSYDVPANATLNINNKGAKAIKYKGANVTGYEISGGDIAFFIYNGTNYNLLSTDGGSGKALIPGGKIWVE